MGVVYKSFDPNIRRSVALKTIRRDLLDDDGAAAFSARFKNEAQAAGSLIHPGIVAVYEYGEEEGYAYIAMEFVEGSSLRHYFEQKVKFGIQDIVSILSQLLDALQYAHEHGVWHRDIKPANIIIMNNGRVKVTDFGIARIESSTLTQVGVIMGTPGFIAPEQYLSHEFDCRIDVFSAGVVLYQLLAGVAPFSGTPESVMFKVCHETPVPPSVAARDPSLERFDPIVLRALAKRAQDRYDSAAHFREALLQAHAQPVNPAVSEETIICAPPLAPAGRGTRDPTAGPAAARNAAPHATVSTGKDSPAPTWSSATLIAAGWDIDELRRVEQHLAHFIGPVARAMVRRAAGKSKDFATLVDRLAEQLGTATERSEFRQRNAHLLAPAPVSAVPSATDQATVLARLGGPSTQHTRAPTPQEVARAAQLLAIHMGPIAQVLVKRAAQPGVSREHFLAGLAAHLIDAGDRERFLSEFG
jgi:serine/threonine-protein kinase